jgi:hypothetical protein
MQQQETQGDSTKMFDLPPKEEKPTQTQAAETKPAKSVEEIKKEGPIYLGGKKFNNVEELAIYTQKLEMTSQAQPAQVQATTKAVANTDKPISELIFEDPERALALHEERVIQKLKAEETRVKGEQQFWTDFYSKNNDLNGESDLVDFVVQKHMGELGHLHPDQAAEKIAEYSRKALVRFRGATETTKALPSGTAKAGPSNTQSAPAMTESGTPTVDFVSQLRKIQRRKK